ncbi:MAG: UDP-3-O-acyl-N-acetylglucosamine deacetylase [Caulobacterales bacterium]|jgi:UDP-3-O-[3-hydroxymyristoyl] N-acetylglucosamine deacetylase
MQATIAQPAAVTGIGVHSAAAAQVRFLPAPAGHGRVFRRTDLADGQGDIPARLDHVVDTRNATTLANAYGARLSTVEHLLCACFGLGLDNLLIEIDGPEAPILDGSARPFVEALQAAGRVAQDGPRPVVKVLRPVEVREGERFARLEPGKGLSFDLSIAYADPAIGAQSIAFAMTDAGSFAAGIAGARTFGHLADLERYHAMGLARGASLANTVAVDQGRVVNPEGLRFVDEFVRHKVLDALGDLALVGAPLIGRLVGHATGHGLHVGVLRALLADRDAFTYV